MSELSVYLNGRIVPADQACISVSDAAVLHGASAFTTMLAHNGRVFRLPGHLERLLGTVGRLGLRTETAAAPLAAAVEELLRAGGLTEARLRITLSPGSVRDDGEARPTTLITAEPLPPQPEDWYRKGLTVVVSSFRQTAEDPTAGLKTGCYLPRVLAMKEAAAKGAAEALWFTHDHRLAEACFCNVFLVLGGKVLTPPVDTPALPGIVRGAVIELCGALGIDCRQDQALTVREMLAAEEIFLTASCSGVRPVVRVERHPVGQERPGPVTQRLASAYRDLLDRECPPRP